MTSVRRKRLQIGARRLASASLLLWSGVASADARPAQASLWYARQPGAEACPTEARLRELVAERLGYDPFQGDAPQRVIVTIAPIPHGLRARITTPDTAASPATATRELESQGEGCEELTQSVVLAVSLAIDPLSIARPRASQSPLIPEPVDRPAPVVEPPRRSPWTFKLSGAARVGLGLVPGASVGPLIDLRAATAGGWALLAEAGADLGPSRVGGVRASLIRGGVGGCDRLSWLLLCVRVDAGALEASGSGADARGGTRFYADVATIAGVDLPLRRNLHGLLGVEALAPFTRMQLEAKQTTVWMTPPIAGALDVGVGYQF